MIQGKSFGLLVADVAVTVIWKEKKKKPTTKPNSKKNQHRNHFISIVY